MIFLSFLSKTLDLIKNDDQNSRQWQGNVSKMTVNLVNGGERAKWSIIYIFSLLYCLAQVTQPLIYTRSTDAWRISSTESLRIIRSEPSLFSSIFSWTTGRSLNRCKNHPKNHCVCVSVCKHVHVKPMKGAGERDLRPEHQRRSGFKINKRLTWKSLPLPDPAAHLKSAGLGANREFLRAISTIWAHGSCLPQSIWRVHPILTSQSQKQHNILTTSSLCCLRHACVFIHGSFPYNGNGSRHHHNRSPSLHLKFHPHLSSIQRFFKCAMIIKEPS